MSEAYQHTECELRNDIDNISCISYTFERYVEEVNHFIDRLLEDKKEINVLRSDIKEKDKEIERLNNIIKEVREYIEVRYNGEVLTHTFDKDNVGELLEILDKGE